MIVERYNSRSFIMTVPMPISKFIMFIFIPTLMRMFTHMLMAVFMFIYMLLSLLMLMLMFILIIILEPITLRQNISKYGGII